MKKILKKAISSILAASIVICAGSAVFAGEQNTAETENVVDACEYGVVGATVMVPADWEYEKYAGAYTLIGSELGQYMAIAVKEYGGVKIDFNDPDAVAELMENAGAEGTITTSDITVCGQPGIWATSEVIDDEDEKLVTYIAVVDMPGSGLLITYSAYGDYDPTFFASVVKSVKMDDCEGDTDIKAVYDGDIITFNPVTSVSAEYRSNLPGRRK